MLFRAGPCRFRFPRPTLIMGVLNVTPDSFSDGGRFNEHDRALDHALELVEEGADIIDVGGESTRPNATSVSLDEELQRVIPVVRSLTSECPETPVSIDTQKPEVARRAIDAGAVIINDIAANRADPEMWQLAARTGSGYVAMHMQGTPQTMQNNPHYEDIVADVSSFFEDRMRRFTDNGIDPEQIVLDVGIGFGKTVEQNLRLLGSISSFQRFNRPLLLGTSRKSFIGKLADTGTDERLAGSLASVVMAVRDGVQIVRVHDVAATRQALLVTEAIMNAAP